MKDFCKRATDTAPVLAFWLVIGYRNKPEWIEEL